MRGWLLVSSLFVFLAGTAVGFVAARTCGTGEQRGPRDRPFGPPFMGLDDLAPFFTSEQVYKDLGLDENQRSKIEGLFSDHKKRVGETHQILARLSEELREGIYAILTPEQTKRFTEIREEYAVREMEAQIGREILGLKRDIPLTDEEEALVRPIYLAAGHERWDLRKNQNPTGDRDREGWQKAWEDIRTRRDDAIQKVLSPEKFQKYKEVKERSRRGGRPDGLFKQRVEKKGS
jgi:hypothetical protein